MEKINDERIKNLLYSTLHYIEFNAYETSQIVKALNEIGVREDEYDELGFGYLKEKE